jgi:citrate lyase subunit beta/citryl-CoA lyase
MLSLAKEQAHRFARASRMVASRQGWEIVQSLHFVPGHQDKFWKKATLFQPPADSIVVDLEDSVPVSEKGVARANAALWAEQGLGNAPIGIRINALDTEFWETDLDATLRHNSPKFYMIPKVSSEETLKRVSAKIASLEAACGRSVGDTKLLPIATEVPEAVFRLREIASAERVVAMTWGCEDLSAAIGATRTRGANGRYLPVFENIRAMTLMAAKAAGVHAIDGVYTDLSDLTGLADEAAEARAMGFDGKLTLHPNQIDVVQQAWAPSEAEIARARKIVAAIGEGGTAMVDGHMVDLPHVRAAEAILANAQRNAARKPPQRPHWGKWYEDLAALEGQVVPAALTRTVTETDNVLFTCLTMNPAPIHLDAEVARRTEFGKVLFNSMFTLALLVGMTVPELTHGTTVANLGFEEVSFPAPLFCGDTVHADTLIKHCRSSTKRPGQGIVKFEHRLYNQKGKLVCKATRNALMMSRPSAL